jgi:tetratricopeptide (TPR) repeat protein
MRGPGFAALPSIRRCQILTNAGNALSFVGRFVEAIELFNKALGIDAAFGHAQGNRAVCLDSYARSLYDDEHVALLLRTAHCDLTAALEVDIDPGARAMFAPLRDRIGGWLPPDFLRDGMDLESFSLGSSPSEVEYRTWCLREGLFLNPLNDLGPLPIAAHDVLTTPSVVTGLHEGPSVPGFFNQLKQEYCSARWIYFEATSRESSHFSDVGVLLYNTLDYPAYSLAVEQAKLAYRAAYSLFDKIAYFMNAYARLGIPEKRVTFRTLWYTAQERSKGIRADLAARENWPWRGLHWLSKDLFEDRPGSASATWTATFWLFRMWLSKLGECEQYGVKWRSGRSSLDWQDALIPQFLATLERRCRNDPARPQLARFGGPFLRRETRHRTGSPRHT